MRAGSVQMPGLSAAQGHVGQEVAQVLEGQSAPQSAGQAAPGPGPESMVDLASAAPLMGELEWPLKVWPQAVAIPC